MLLSRCPRHFLTQVLLDLNRGRGGNYRKDLLLLRFGTISACCLEFPLRSLANLCVDGEPVDISSEGKVILSRAGIVGYCRFGREWPLSVDLRDSAKNAKEEIICMTTMPVSNWSPVVDSIIKINVSLAIDHHRKSLSNPFISGIFKDMFVAIVVMQYSAVMSRTRAVSC